LLLFYRKKELVLVIREAKRVVILPEPVVNWREAHSEVKDLVSSKCFV